MPPSAEPTTFLLPPLFDYAATFAWSVSGALVGARRGYDFVGIFIIALVSATGGGLLRDGLFLHDGPPILVRTPVYLGIVAAGTLTIVLFGRRVRQIRGFDRLIGIVDGLGLGAYAVVGLNRAAAVGLDLTGAVLVGMVNATGGGVLRSVLAGKEPKLFRPGAFEAVAAFIGCLEFLLLTRLALLGQTPAAWVTIATVFLVRLVSVTFGVETRPLQAFEDDWSRDADRL